MLLNGGGNASVEIDLDGPPFNASPVWTNISADANTVFWVDVDHGRNPYTKQYDIGVLRVLLKGRNWDPDNPSSPYAGKLTADKRIRVRGTPAVATTKPVFDGYTARWEPQEEVNGIFVVLLTAFDPLWLFERDKRSDVGFRDTILKWTTAAPATLMPPTAYYRLGDKDSPTTALDDSGNEHHGHYAPRVASGTNGYRIGAQGLLTSDADRALDCGNRDRHLKLPRSAALSGSAGCGIAFLVKPVALPSSGTDELYSGNFATVKVLLNPAPGTVTFQAPGGVSATIGGVLLTLNVPNLVVMRRKADGLSWQFYIVDINGVGGQTGGTASFVVNLAADFGYVGRGLAGVIDEVVVWSSLDPGENFTNMFAIADRAWNPGVDERGVDRWGRRLDWVSWPSGRRSSSYENKYEVALGPYNGAPSTGLQDLRTVAETMGAEVYADAAGNMVYKGYQLPSTPTPQVVFDDTGSNTTFAGRTAVRGELDRRSRVTVSDGTHTAAIELESPTPGAAADESISAHPARHSDHVADVALRVARQRLLPGTRLSPLEVRLLDLTTAQRTAVLGLDLTSPISVARSGQTVTGRVVRLRHRITPTNWRVQIETEAQPPDYTPSARASHPNDQAVATGSAFAPVIAGERWDTDKLHNSLLLASTKVGSSNPTTDIPAEGRMYMRDFQRYLAWANVMWEAGAATPELLIRNPFSSTVLGRVRGAPAPGGYGPIQAVGALYENGSSVSTTPFPIPLEVQVRQTSGSNKNLRTSVTGSWSPPGIEILGAVPFGAFSPEFAIAEIPAAAHAVQAYRSSSITVPSGSGTQTPVACDSERFDTNGMHSTSSNTHVLVPQKQATFLYMLGLTFSANATGRRIGVINDGGTSIGVGGVLSAGSVEKTAIQPTALWRAAAFASIDFQAVQDSGSSLTVDVDGNHSPSIQAVEMMGSSARRTNSTGPVALNGAHTLLTLDTLRWDDGGVGTNTDRMVATYAGPWFPWANVAWPANGAGERELYFVLNDELIIAYVCQPAASTGPAYTQLWTEWWMDADDYVKCYFRQTSGVDMTLNKSANHSPEFGMACLVAAA